MAKTTNPFVLFAFLLGFWLKTTFELYSHVSPDIQKEQHDAGEMTTDRAAHIDEIMSHVEPEYKAMCRPMLEGEAVSFSQGWQDWMMYHNYFRDRKWGEGFYLDIGTNHPTIISNSLFFDKCLGWKGICAEPQTQYHEGIKAKRGCHLVPTCVLGKDTRVSVGGQNVMFHVSEAKASDADTMECVGIKTLQHKFGFSKIDFVSLDIEGAEPSVLHSWPFEEVETTMFVVETNKLDVRDVDLFFHRNNYINVDSYVPGKKYLDNLYVKAPPKLTPPMEHYECTKEMRKFRKHWCYKWEQDVTNSTIQ